MTLTTEYEMTDRPAPPFPKSRKPGIYFGLPEADYHADPALSNSGIKWLRVSPMDYWARSHFNPDYEDEKSSFMVEGTAWHKRILEGREAFYELYAADIEASDYPGALRVMDDLKAELKGRGLPVSGKKEELVNRLLAVDDAPPIWDALVAAHREQHEGKTLLPFDTIKRIELQAAMIERHPDISRCFHGGYPEVSIFWRHESGCPMKARLDYMKIGADIDLKTLGNHLNRPVDRAIILEMANHRYHIQAAVYTEAARAAQQHVKAGRIFGEADPKWLKAFAERDMADRQFVFVFQQTGIAPVAKARVFPRMLTYDAGKFEMDQAIQEYVNCLETFGTDPWIDMSPIETFDDAAFPMWMTGALS